MALHEPSCSRSHGNLSAYARMGAFMLSLWVACAPEAPEAPESPEAPKPQKPNGPASEPPRETGLSIGPAKTPAAVERLQSAPVAEEIGGLDDAAVALMQESVDTLNAAIDLPDAWTQLGMVYQANRRFELARTCYEQRLLRDSVHPRTLYYLAQVAEQLGDTREALEYLDRCVSHDATYPPAFWQRGLLHLALGEVESAATDMEAALELAPHDAAANVGLARVRLQQERSREAVSLLEKHLQRLPKDYNALYLLGTAYRKVGRTEDAARALRVGSGGDPVREDPWLGEIYSLRRGYRREFLNAVDALTAGDVEGAILALEELHEREPKDTLIHLSLHRAYRIHGEWDRAYAILIEARDLEPLEDMVYLHLAGAYLEKASKSESSTDSLLEKALESVDRTCELSPTFANGHGMRGDVLMAAKRYEEATDAYALAARLDRSSFMWNDKAARTLCQSTRWAEAVPVLQQLDALRPNTANILYLWAVALANSGRVNEALAPIERARSLAPDDAKIQSGLENIKNALGKKP